MAKKENIQEAGEVAAGGQGSETLADQTAHNIETVEDLEACYPQLVSKMRDEVVIQIGKCPIKELKANLPELYERIVTDIKDKGGPNLKVPGFLLEVDDPFAESTLQAYQGLKGIDELRLPFVLPFQEKGKGQIRETAWKMKFEKSETLKAEFKDINAYLVFKGRIITQALEHYILVAEGGGDYERANAAHKAMKKIK